MNCYYHPQNSAVALCPDCAKGLCSECARRYSPPICSGCNRRRGFTEIREIIIELVVTFGLGIFLGTQYMYLTQNPDRPIPWGFYVYVFSGIVCGWRFLQGQRTGMFILILPVIGWLIYFLVNLALSCCIGFFLLPVRTARNLYRLTRLLVH